MESLLDEALDGAISEIQLNVGLTLIPQGEWLELYGVEKSLLAVVPMTDDPLGDVDRIRGVWFETARSLSNDSWD